MTSSQLTATARTDGTAGRRAATETETGIKALWEPLLELLNGSPVAQPAAPVKAGR
ncbi:hypothetical protein Q0Z83_060920 [Actinoplanes sichuanensis]|uniref:Uncharacterized protein n=1 Tax=Actinoplanes sichuanensis TaxID=512349 RepID=A0ABW4A6G3_9ACTN|nr:hypothetical protein [Actinoplanes sichuanensis]BEL07901.1 hypothetical protein Q0Z83_060920 [Actinoplanes sichuanensis]